MFHTKMDQIQHIFQNMFSCDSEFSNSDLQFLPALILYFPIIISLKIGMGFLSSETKKSIKNTIKGPHEIWNLSLSIFSLWGAINCIKHFSQHGYGCNFDDNIYFVLQCFCLSKVPELLDTVFIILNDKKLVLLQYYHHFATLALCYFGYMLMPSGLLIAAMMNYSVHFIMYGYFFLVSIGYKGLRRFGYIVTFFQLLQMAVAVILLFTLEPEACIQHDMNMNVLVNISTVMYTSYLILFAELFASKM
jgi:elongation of very long chain fatty acids protein 6